MSKRATRTTARSTEILPCKLTGEEIQAKAQIAARRLAERDTLEDQLSTVKSEFKAKLEDIDAEVRETMRHVREGAIERSVQVETLMDWKSNSVTTVRLDTGEVIRTRAMTPEERQTRLFDLDDDKDAAAGDQPTA